MTWQVWTHGSTGWWAGDSGFETFEAAAKHLAAQVKCKRLEVDGGAIVPDGDFPWPRCWTCWNTKKPRQRKAKPTGKK